jgi:hypothetical protein
MSADPAAATAHCSCGRAGGGERLRKNGACARLGARSEIASHFALRTSHFALATLHLIFTLLFIASIQFNVQLSNPGLAATA